MRDGRSLQAYYGHVGRLVGDYLSKQDPAYLLNVDFHEYLDYLCGEFAWEPLDFNTAAATVETFNVKVKRSDSFTGDQYTRDEPRIRIRIPISRHPQRDMYFEYMPSHMRLNGEPPWKFEGDTIMHEVDATEQAVKRGIEDVEFWLGNRNEDIEKGNSALKGRIRVVWEAKRQQLEEEHGRVEGVVKNLGIPLHRDPNSRAKPVEMKLRQVRTVLEKPQPKQGEPQRVLHRDDFVNLVAFIDQYVRQFEVAPATYSKLSEEELRDLLVSMMNTNYPGSTTAETFNKLGKTDIRLHVNEGNVLICECKIWSGARAYAKSLEQLFGYLTWRQSYGVLMHFCKLKEMTKAVTEAKRALTEHPSTVAGSVSDDGGTRFTSRHKHPQDSEKLVEVDHLFVDLSV